MLKKQIYGKNGAMLGLAIFFVIIGALVLIGRIEHKASIGATQTDMLKAYTNFENTRTYIETAIRYSAREAIKQLGGACPAADRTKFEIALAEQMRKYTSVDLSAPTYKVEFPKDYDFVSAFANDKITIVGLSKGEIKITSTAEKLVGKLSRTTKSGQEYEDLPNSDYVLLKLKAPKYLVSGGANINIDITCDELDRFEEALAYVPKEEVSQG